MKNKPEKWEKSIKSYQQYYDSIRFILRPFFFAKVRPYTINLLPLGENQCHIIAPNHLRTLDSMILAGAIPPYVRWGALKRFFDAKDSIFANNKNWFLRHLTAWMFRNTGALPIERDKENWTVLKEIYRSARAGVWLGFFPEGTTNKHPETVLVREPKPSIFAIAKATKAKIQPVALTWASREQSLKLPGKNRLIINYRPAFEVLDVDEACKQWKESIIEGIWENRDWIAQEMV